MTKFDELMDLINHNKNKEKKEQGVVPSTEQDIELEVSGAESNNKGPLVASASEELDPDIIDMLYTKPRHVPNRGEGASSWSD
jgi:hypothetical protein